MLSASDSAPQVPGFTDHLGERFIVPQPSGSLLEHLHFRRELSVAPYFEPAVKERVSRLANVRHSTYTRVRRFQRADEGTGLVLVSAHVPGRRLSEILQIMGRAGHRPPTAAVLALSRQLMTAIALLHDYGPDIFHGTIGPERLVLPGDGRVVVCEYVLGAAFEQAAATSGVATVWRESRVPMLADTGLARYGRRVDLAQIGLVTLACLVGRPLTASEYPDGISFLLDEVQGTTPDGERCPLSPDLRAWIGGLISPQAQHAFKTLVEAQKAFAQLLERGSGLEASPSALQAFVQQCESLDWSPASPVHETEATSVPPQPEAASVATDLFAGIAVTTPEQAPSWRDVPAFEVEPEPVAITLFEPGPAAEPESPSEPAENPGGFESCTARSEPSTASWEPPGESRPAAAHEGYGVPTDPREAGEREAAGEPAAASYPQPARGRESPAGEAQAAVLDPRPGPEHPSPQARLKPDYQPAAPRTRPRERAPKPRWGRIAALVAVLVLAGLAAAVAPFAWSRVVGEGKASAWINVHSEPPGAEILLDGRQAGRTPARLAAAPGAHNIEVGSGGSSKSFVVNVPEDGEVTQRVELPEATERGGLRIATNPPGGRISVDGEERGTAPVRVTDLSPGSHKVIADGPFGPVEMDAIVEPGGVTPVTVPTVGWVRVKAPFELQVSERGRVYGSSGSGAVMVPAGRRNLELVNSTLAVKARHFLNVPAGAIVQLPFDAPMGMMNLSSDEPADVWLDGQSIGQTPLTSLAVPLGSHEVVFRHARMGDVSYTVVVSLAAPVRLTVTFNKK